MHHFVNHHTNPSSIVEENGNAIVVTNNGSCYVTPADGCKVLKCIEGIVVK